MPNFVLPHIFKDGAGETASGVQVMDDLNKLKEQIEALENKGLLGSNAAQGFVSRATSLKPGENEYEGSATRPTEVKLTVTCEANSSMTVFVGATEVGGCGSEGSAVISITFILGPGEKWRFTSVKVALIRSTYRTL